MKRMTAFCLALLLSFYTAAAAQAPAPPVLLGQKAVLYCAENGQVLFGQDMNTPAHPASITKLMTALLVLESGIDLSQTVTVSHDAVHSIDRQSTHIALDTGEQVTLEQMMYAMLITSANDASNVLAEAVAGSQAAFAAQMTARAKELGCESTNFVNAHGLDDTLHYTTAYDMAVITAALLKYEEFSAISSTRVYHMPATNKQSQPREFWNKQNLLNPNSKFYDPSAIAGKNGFTSKAGHTLVTAARRGGITLIAVTMGSLGRYDKQQDTVALFDYGFGQFYPCSLSPDAIAAAATARGLEPDVNAIAPLMVLVPNQNTVSDLTFSGTDYHLTATCGAGDQLPVTVPAATTTAAPVPPEELRTAQQDAEKIPAHRRILEAVKLVPEKLAQLSAGIANVPRMYLYAGLGMAAALGLFLLSAVRRAKRVRRKRAEIRALLARHRTPYDE